MSSTESSKRTRREALAPPSVTSGHQAIVDSFEPGCATRDTRRLCNFGLTERVAYDELSMITLLTSVLADHGSSNTAIVGLAGFEPAASATQTRRASQAALQPVLKGVYAQRGPVGARYHLALGAGRIGVASGFTGVEAVDQDQRRDEYPDHGDEQRQFRGGHGGLAAEHEKDLPDHRDQADREQRLGDQVVSP
jgi:hypothetical protein